VTPTVLRRGTSSWSTKPERILPNGVEVLEAETADAFGRLLSPIDRGIQ
jgi:hypothetical protein